MTIQTLYPLFDTAAASPAAAFGTLQIGGSAPATADSASGWTVAKIAAARYAPYKRATKQTSGALVTSPVHPDGTLDNTNGDALRTGTALTGTFAAGAWTFAFKLRATTASSQQDRLRLRVYRSTDGTGAGATEITAATQVGSTVTANTTEQAATVSWTAPQITLNGEFMFVELAIETVVAGGSNSSDWLLRAGSSSITTTDFANAVNLASAAVATAGGSADLFKSVSLAGSALAVAGGSAGMALSVPLAATAVAQASGAAQMNLSVTLSAAAVASALSTATAAVEKPLASAGGAQAAGTADLSVSAPGATVNLAAAGQAQAGGTATLTLLVTLGASGQAQAGGDASMWIQVALSAAALAQAAGAGEMSLTVPLSAAAIAQAAGSGGLSLQVFLSADGRAIASGMAEVQVSRQLTASKMTRRGIDCARRFSAIDRARGWRGQDAPRRLKGADRRHA